MDALDSLELAPLRMLVAIAAWGTLTEAARRLSLSQPAATHQIRSLERALGVALFVRQGRRLVLSQAGELALERARRVIAQLEGLGQDLRELNGLERGEVRLGGGATATTYLLPPAIAAFRAEHPAVRFTLREGSADAVLAGVLAGELDLGVMTRPGDVPQLVSHPWREDAVLVLGAPGCELEHGRRSASELEGQPFILPGKRYPLRTLVESALLSRGITVRNVMELESIEALKACVEAGLGYAALGSLSVERELAEGRLVSLDVADLKLSRELSVIHRSDRPLEAAARAFLGALVGASPAGAMPRPAR